MTQTKAFSLTSFYLLLSKAYLWLFFTFFCVSKSASFRLAFYELAEKSALAALSLAEKDKRENVLQAVAFMHDVTNAK